MDPLVATIKEVRENLPLDCEADEFDYILAELIYARFKVTPKEG
jgi:hypothetical protein